MIMMFAYIFIAIAAQLWNEREVIDEVSKFSNTAFISRKDVDDRAERSLVNDLGTTSFPASSTNRKFAPDDSSTYVRD